MAGDGVEEGFTFLYLLNILLQAHIFKSMNKILMLYT